MKHLKSKIIQRSFFPKFLAFHFLVFSLISCHYQRPSELKNLIQRSFLLQPDYQVGDEDCYQIETIYRELDDAGHIAQTLILNGYFTRKIEALDHIQRKELFTWAYAAMAESKNRHEPQDNIILPFTRNFQYSFKDWNPQHFPVDISLIPKTLEGWRFYVNLLDAHTFDVIGNINNFNKDSISIGDKTVLLEKELPVLMDFPPLYTDTYFVNSPFHIDFHGISLIADDPCAIIFFRSDDCNLHMKAHVNNRAFPTDGVSFYWGEVYISLKTGRINGGKIFERVDLTISLPGPVKSMKHSTLREITLTKVNQEYFNQLVKQSGED